MMEQSKIEFHMSKNGVDMKRPVIFIGNPGAYVMKAISDSENWTNACIFPGEPNDIAREYDPKHKEKTEKEETPKKDTKDWVAEMF